MENDGGLGMWTGMNGWKVGFWAGGDERDGSLNIKVGFLYVQDTVAAMM